MLRYTSYIANLHFNSASPPTLTYARPRSKTLNPVAKIVKRTKSWNLLLVEYLARNSAQSETRGPKRNLAKVTMKFPNSANDRTKRDNELPKLLRVARQCKNHEMQSSSQAWLWRYQRQIKRQWCSKMREFRSSKKMTNQRVQLSTENDVPNWATKISTKVCKH